MAEVNDLKIAEALYDAVILQMGSSVDILNEVKDELKKKSVFLVRGSYMATALDADMLYNALTGFYFETDEEISNIATRDVKRLVSFLDEIELCYAVTYSEELCFNLSKYISYFSEKSIPDDIYLSFGDSHEDGPSIDGFIFHKDMADALNLTYTELSDDYVYVKDFAPLIGLAPTPRGFSKILEGISSKIEKEAKAEDETSVGKVRVILD